MITLIASQICIKNFTNKMSTEHDIVQVWLPKWFLSWQPCISTFQLQGPWTILKSCGEMMCRVKYYPDPALVLSHKQMVVYVPHDLHPAKQHMKQSTELPVKSKCWMHWNLWKHANTTMIKFTSGKYRHVCFWRHY